MFGHVRAGNYAIKGGDNFAEDLLVNKKKLLKRIFITFVGSLRVVDKHYQSGRLH